MNKRRIPSPVIAESALVSFGKHKIEFMLPENPAAESLIYGYPTVYVVYAQPDGPSEVGPSYIAYVGETNNIENRTSQHLKADPKVRPDWREFRELAENNPSSVRQFVIGHSHFNKSLTLDIENRMMQYLLGVDSIKSLNNRRTNPQGNYYTREELDEVFARTWRKLNSLNSKLFPSERIIRDSALFKASPFHELTKAQLDAERSILEAILCARERPVDMKTEFGDLVLVQGAAGTGKTVLISHLFNALLADSEQIEGSSNSDASDVHPLQAFVLVNHREQKNVYNQIARKLGLQKRNDEVVLKPTQFINRRSEKVVLSTGRSKRDISKPMEKVDVALVDEAHLLLTQGNQGYAGTNMLLDIMRRAKVTIAVFDPDQILETGQQWSEHDLNVLLGDGKTEGGDRFESVELEDGSMFNRASVVLKHQFRIAAGPETIKWIDDFASGRAVDTIPKEAKDVGSSSSAGESYEIRVFDSPVKLWLAIREKAADAESRGLSRVLATYDWAYNGQKGNSNSSDGAWNVELHRDEAGVWKMGLDENDKRGFIINGDAPDSNRFCHPWNYQLDASGSVRRIDGSAWAERPETIDEIGSTFTIQGFDLNYAGVIIGPSVKLREGKLIFDSKASKNKRAVSKRSGVKDYSDKNLRNELNVLLKRGVHGLYLFAVDPELQLALERAARG